MNIWVEVRVNATLGDATVFGCPSVGECSGYSQGYHVTVYSDGVVVQGVEYGNTSRIVNTRTILY